MDTFKNILKDYTYLVSANILSSILKILATFIITAYLLDASEFGIYSIILVIANVMVLGVNWFFPSLIRFSREDIEKKKRINATFWSGLLVTFVLSLIVLFIFLLVRGRLASLLTLEIPYWATIAVLTYFFFFSIYYYLLATLQTELKFRYSSILRVLLSFLFIVLLLIYWKISSGTTPVMILLMLSLSHFISALVGLGLIERSLFSFIGVTKKKIKQMLDYSWPHILGTAAAFVFFYADKIILKYYHSNESVGIYSLATSLLFSLLVFPELLTNITFPVLTSLRFRKNSVYVDYYLNRTLSHLMVLSSIIAMSISFFALYLISFVYKNVFSLATVPFEILMIGAMFASLRRFLSPVFGAFDLIKQITWITCMGAVAGLFFMYVLVPKYDYIGASIALTLLLLTENIIAFVYLYIKTDLRDIKPIFLAVPASIVILSFITISNFYARLSILCVGLGVYLFIIRFFRIFSANDFETIAKFNMPKTIKSFILKIGSLFFKVS